MDMWTPYKELHNTVEAVLARPDCGVSPSFIQLLKRHKQNFITLLKNPPKNAKSREELNKGAADGINLPDVGLQVLSKDLVEEALILSDMYNLNELLALDLLCTAQAQMPYHPGLTRGLVAIILYYDGRKSLVLALKALVLARRGFTFTADCSEEVLDFVTEYTDELVSDGLMTRILELLESLDMSKEVDLLQQNRALGGAKHHKQVVDLFESVRSNLAMILFFWSTQCGLTQDSTLKLIQHLKKTQLEATSTGGADCVPLTLTLTLLYALDLSLLQRVEDTDPIINDHPLLSEKTFIPTLMRDNMGTINGWATPGLGAVTALAWGLSLATLKQSPQHLHPAELNDEDDQAVDAAIEGNVFEFLYRTLFENRIVYEEEFFLRRFHQLFTDFIVLMPHKVREMKNKGDEASRVTSMYLSQGLEAPQVSHHFESLLQAIATLYAEDPLHLELCLDYWSVRQGSNALSHRLQPRQVALIKFVRKIGEMLPSLLFVPYLKMICSISNSPKAAQHCFNFLRTEGNAISWDHFFDSLNRYYSNLHMEQPPMSDTIYRHRSMVKGITPQELQGLHSVLAVIRVVSKNNEEARVALCENPGWSAMTVLLGLVSCSVPIVLKADLLLALAALAGSPASAAALWHNLEASQIITTVPSTSSYSPRGIKTELDEVESRNEEYPLTRALLELLDTLTNYPVPRLLGSGTRTPGFDPYLNFVVGSVLLKFHQRGYRRIEERWQVAGQCLGLLVKLLKQYEPSPQDFSTLGTQSINPPPGHHIMINLNAKSELLRLLLQLLDDGVQSLDTFTIFPGKSALEEALLRCLELLDIAITLQPAFLALASTAGTALLLPGLTRMLLGTNPRSGRPDYLLTITRLIRYNSWLPSHAWRATRILVVAATQPGAQAHLVAMYTATPALKTEIRHGFVECLEAEGDEGDDVRTKTKLAILKLIEDSMNLPLPNVALYLIGFDLTKDTSKTVFQQPGVAQAPRTVLHSLLAIMNMGLRAKSGELAMPPSSHLLECCYRLLYKMCSGTRTAAPVLRFLRAGTSFLPRQLSAIPFKQHKEPAERQQMAWLLKTAAIELKVCAAGKLTSQLEAIFSAIIGDTTDDEEEVKEWNPRVLDPDSMSSSSLTGKKNDQRFLRLLTLTPFQCEQENRPDLEVFEWSDLEIVMGRCEVLENNVNIIDVKKLHRVLVEESASITGRAAAQRRLVQKDIEAACASAIANNKIRTRAAASLHLLSAWRRLTETLFSVVTAPVLSNDYRQELLIDTLHNLLYKVHSSSSMPTEVAILSSEVLVMLLVNLRLAQIIEGHEAALHNVDPREVSLRGFGGEGRQIERDATNGELNIILSTLQANAATLKNILTGILQWIVNSSNGSQKLRANLYGALLNFLYTTCYIEENEGESVGLDASLRPADNSVAEQRSLVLRVVAGFAEGLAYALGHDGTASHNLTSMLALSCLEVLMRMDASAAWQNYLSERGYLQLLVDSLMNADDALVELCTGEQIRNLRPLYMFECKLALLTRIASTRDGALLLMEQSAVNVLSAMKVFDIIPKVTSSQPIEEFLPSPTERFQQVVFPAFDFLDSLITSLGTDNRSGNEAIVHFLLCHGDMVSAVLRACHSHLPLAARLTSLIARSADVGPVDDATQLMGVHSVHLLRSLMLQVLSSCYLSEIRGRDDDKQTVINHILQISCNVMMYLRSQSASKDPLDCRATEPILWPGLTEAQGGEGRGGQSPLLGSVVQILQEATTYYHKEIASVAEITRQLASIPSMTVAEVQEIASTRAQASNQVSTKLGQKKQEMELTSFLIENALYVTWSHLDFFMLRAFPRLKASVHTDKMTNVLNVTTQDISVLKSGLVSVFNDNFCRKIVDIKDCSQLDSTFLDALVRRIKRLLQFVPVK